MTMPKIPGEYPASKTFLSWKTAAVMYLRLIYITAGILYGENKSKVSKSAGIYCVLVFIDRADKSDHVNVTRRVLCPHDVLELKRSAVMYLRLLYITAEVLTAKTH